MSASPEGSADPERAERHDERHDEGDASHATQLVGGIMLGAAGAAVLQQLLAADAARAPAALLLATLCILSAWKLGRYGDAADAAGLAFALSVPFLAAHPSWSAALGLGVALLASFVTIAQRGRSPLALLAAATFFVGARQAAGVDLLVGLAAAPAALLFLALLAYGGFAAHQSRQGGAWSGRAVALTAALLLLASFPLLDAVGVTDAGIAALCLGTLMGALLAAGIMLRVRALVATMTTLLPIAILAFALLALGPALAAVVLLCLGGALVWQAEHVRGLLLRRDA